MSFIAANKVYTTQIKPQSFGLNIIYSFILIISSTNKYRKHKSSMLI